jgi:hypothetical protein
MLPHAHTNICKLVGPVRRRINRIANYDVFNLKGGMVANKVQIIIWIFVSLFQGDLAAFLKRKGQLKAQTAVRFALDIARFLTFFLFSLTNYNDCLLWVGSQRLQWPFLIWELQLMVHKHNNFVKFGMLYEVNDN